MWKKWRPLFVVSRKALNMTGPALLDLFAVLIGNGHRQRYQERKCDPPLAMNTKTTTLPKKREQQQQEHGQAQER